MASGKKFNLYIQAKNLAKWERIPPRERSTWVNKKLDDETIEPVWIESEQRWSDS